MDPYPHKNKLFSAVFVILMVAVGFSAQAQNQTAKVTPAGTWFYEYLPPDYNSNNNDYPIVFFFHGIGERGDTETDLANVAKFGPPKHVKDGYKFPFILISPQLKRNIGSWQPAYMDEVVEYVKSYLRIDLSRVYVTGLSLGGGGTWTYSQDARLGQKLAAVAVICGGYNNPSLACNFGKNNIPVWAFHGDADNVVSYTMTTRMVDAINACNPAPNPLAKLTIYPGVDHNSWDRAYRTDNQLHTPNVYQWLMQFRNEGLVVNAGHDQTINLPTNSITLRGTASAPNATITSYAWTKTSGPAATLANAASSTLSVSGMVEGVYTFRLTVKSSNGENVYDDVKVTVVRTNQAPIANAGPDLSITLPTNSVTINGTGSDSDGSIASYAWEKVSGPTVTMSGASTAKLSLSNLIEGTYTFALTVRDNEGATATDRVNVVVHPAEVNESPVANAGADRTINLPLNTTIITGTGSDADGTITSYRWEKISGPTATLANANTASLTVSNMLAGVYVFRLTVTDDDGATGSDEIRVTVIEANQTPVADAGTDITLTLPTNSTNLNGSGNDPDGAIVKYEWTQVSGPSTITIANASAATSSVANLIAGTYVFRLTVTDDDAATASDEVSVVVNPAEVNRAPIADAGEDQTIHLPTNSTTLRGSASDEDGTIVSYQWVKTGGPAATLSNQNTPNLGLTNLQAGVYKFELRVTDDDGATDSDVVNVIVLEANQTPTASAGSDITIVLPTSSTTLNGSGFDPDGNVVGYQWVQISGPTNATIASPATSSTIVSDLEEGVYVFELTVTDDDDAIASDEVRVSVEATGPNVPPAVSAGADKTLTLPQGTVVINGTASDSDGTVVSYLWELVSGPSCTLADETTPDLSVSDLVSGQYKFRFTATDDDGASASDEMILTIQPEVVNQSPLANAGPDQLVKLPQNTWTLNGSGTDPDGTITVYAWAKISGPAVTLSGENTASVELSDLQAGTYRFTLTVTDDKGATDSDEVIVTVTAENSLPVANAGADKTITLPANSVTINGSGSDSDGSIVSYAWSQVSGPAAATITNGNTSSVLIEDLVEGTYVFNLEVTDDAGAMASDQVKVTVNSANQAPVVTINTNRTITLPADKANFTATGRDDDGSVVSYQWTQISGPAGAVLENAETATLTVTVTNAGTYWFRVTVRDNDGATGFADARLTVNLPTVNQAPTANAGPNRSITLPVNNLTINGSGTDPDGTIASYSWIKVSGPAATLGNANTATLSLTNLVQGTYVFKLTVTDNGGLIASADVTVTVLPEIVNIAPVANAGADRTIKLPTNSLNITGSGSDQDGTIASYSWSKVSGPAATITNGNLPTVSLSNLVEGVYVFRLTVRDDKGATGSDDVRVTVNAADVNQAPRANAGADRTITLPANSLQITGSGSDADGSIASYRWTKVSGPAATMAGTTTTTLQLSNLVEGVYVFRLQVTDNGGLSHTDDVQVTVLAQNVNQSPVANAGADKTITLPLNTITIQGSASDPDGTVTAYLWTKLSGPAATLTNTGTPTLTVTDMVAGTYVFRLRVTDDKGAIDTDDVRVIVNPASTNEPPVANAGEDVTVTLPVSIATLHGSASDDDGSIAKYTWTKVSGPGVTMTNANQATLSLSGLQEGSYVFRLTVEDNDGATAYDQVSVTVLPEAVNIIPVVNAGTDIVVIEPVSAANLTGTASDADGNITTIQWTQVAGAPAVITDPGRLSTGVSDLVVGTYKFMLTVTDDDGASASDEITITVKPANTNQAPVANAGPDRTTKLPENSITLQGSGTDADGTIASYLWEKVSGPTVVMGNVNAPQLIISELVAGTYYFRLTVTDDDNASNEDLVIVTVLPADLNLPPVANAGPDRSIQLPQNEVTISGSATDEDASSLTFLWEQVEGPAVSLSETNQRQFSLSNLAEGVYSFRLTVTDNEGLSDFDEMTLIVFTEAPVTPAPVVTTTPDVVVQLPENSATLRVDVSAESGMIASYHWQQTGGPTINYDMHAENILVVENLTPGVYVFVVTVTDIDGQSTSEEIKITVLDENPEIRPRKLFSPDAKGDLTSETWTIENAHLLDGCEIVVYNREGQQVYSSIGYPVPWDGLSRGVPVPDGAYYYVIRRDGRVIKKGSVTIARLK